MTCCFEVAKLSYISNQIFQEEKKSTNLTIYCIFLNLEFADRINCICNSLGSREKGNKKNFDNASLRLSSEDNGNSKSKLLAQKNQKFSDKNFLGEY